MDINTKTNNEFKAELKALLAKYDACIEVLLDGDDLHGVGTELIITRGSNPEVEIYRTSEESIDKWDF